MKKYIVALDEGTTSTRAVLYDIKSRKIVMQKSSPIEQIYPETSFVEENANEIYAETLSSSPCRGSECAAGTEYDSRDSRWRR